VDKAIGFGFNFLGAHDFNCMVTRQIGEVWGMFSIACADLVRLCNSSECGHELPLLISLHLHAIGESEDELIVIFNDLDCPARTAG